MRNYNGSLLQNDFDGNVMRKHIDVFHSIVKVGWLYLIAFGGAINPLYQPTKLWIDQLISILKANLMLQSQLHFLF